MSSSRFGFPRELAEWLHTVVFAWLLMLLLVALPIAVLLAVTGGGLGGCLLVCGCIGVLLVCSYVLGAIT